MEPQGYSNLVGLASLAAMDPGLLPKVDLQPIEKKFVTTPSTASFLAAPSAKDFDQETLKIMQDAFSSGNNGSNDFDFATSYNEPAFVADSDISELHASIYGVAPTPVFAPAAPTAALTAAPAQYPWAQSTPAIPPPVQSAPTAATAAPATPAQYSWMQSTPAIPPQPPVQYPWMQSAPAIQPPVSAASTPAQYSWIQSTPAPAASAPAQYPWVQPTMTPPTSQYGWQPSPNHIADMVLGDKVPNMTGTTAQYTGMHSDEISVLQMQQAIQQSQVNGMKSIWFSKYQMLLVACKDSNIEVQPEDMVTEKHDILAIYLACNNLENKLKWKRYSTMGGDYLTMMLRGAECIFDGKTSVFGYRPNLTNFTDSVAGRIKRLRPELAVTMHDILSDFRLGPAGSIMFELGPSLLTHLATRSTQKDGKATRGQWVDEITD